MLLLWDWVATETSESADGLLFIYDFLFMSLKKYVSYNYKHRKTVEVFFIKRNIYYYISL